MSKTNTGSALLSAVPSRLAQVRYWSVYNQRWTYAYAQSDIPGEEWAAQDDATRAMFKQLPEFR